MTPEIVTTFLKTLRCVRTVTFFAPAFDIGWHAHDTETDELYPAVPWHGLLEMYYHFKLKLLRTSTAEMFGQVLAQALSGRVVELRWEGLE